MLRIKIEYNFNGIDSKQMKAIKLKSTKAIELKKQQLNQHVRK